MHPENAGIVSNLRAKLFSNAILSVLMKTS